MRILLSEGASTSAREAITALGLRGHHVEVCDPDPHCLGRFSRFVRRLHRCPPLGRDPQGYLAFILDRISGGQFASSQVRTSSRKLSRSVMLLSPRRLRFSRDDRLAGT